MTKRDDYLDRAALIHCCKDRTLTCRTRKEKVFNGRALAVFSADTKAEAETLILLVCSKQYEAHPLMPGKPWHKVNVSITHEDGAIEFLPYLELEHLDLVTEILQRAYDRMKQNQRSRTDDSPRTRGRVSRVKGRRHTA